MLVCKLSRGSQNFALIGILEKKYEIEIDQIYLPELFALTNISKLVFLFFLISLENFIWGKVDQSENQDSEKLIFCLKSGEKEEKKS